MVIRRGDIFYADLRPVVGSEQGGIRPVLILQNDVGNRHSPTVICAAVTSKMKGDFKRAYEFYKSAYKIEPSPFYLSSMAAAALDAEDFEQAVNYYEILCSSEPDKGLYKFNLASAYEGLKNYEKALELLENLNKSENTAFHVKLRIAGIRIKLRDYETAKEIYMGLIKKGRVDENIYYDFAILCGHTGDKDKAENN